MGRLSLALVAGAFASAAPAQPADYTGFWKRNCEDHVGLHIKRVRTGTYSISLCNPDGCTLPGKYRPNTAIDGDPGYDVVGPSRIRLKDADGGYAAYVKCTSDATPPVLRPQ